jgi:hypothetical protein
MKIRLLLPALILATQVAFGGRFDLPKQKPLVSVEIPETWQTELEGDTVTARPAKNSKVVFSVMPISGAGNLQDAFATVTKQVSAKYSDFAPGKSSSEKEAGMDVLSAEAKGKSDGIEFRIAFGVFTPDGQHFFGLFWACDESSGEKYRKRY